MCFGLWLFLGLLGVVTAEEACVRCEGVDVCLTGASGLEFRVGVVVRTRLPSPLLEVGRSLSKIWSTDGNYIFGDIGLPLQPVDAWELARDSDACASLTAETPVGAVQGMVSVDADQRTFSVDFTLARSGAVGRDEVVHLRSGVSVDPRSPVFGAGTQYTRVDLRGKRVPVVTTEQGVGRGVQPLSFLLDLFANNAGGNWHTTYSPSPHFLTASGQDVWADNYELAVLDFRSPHRATVAAVFEAQDRSPALHLRLHAAASPLAAVAHFTAQTGRMAALPDWVHAHGAVLGVQGGTAEVEAIWRNVTAAGAAVGGLWMQDWSGLRQDTFGQRLWWNWRLDTSHYAGWQSFVDRVHAGGARVLIYINPYLSDTGRNSLFLEAKQKGFLLATCDGEPYVQSSGSAGFTFGTVDLGNPAARAWYRGTLVYMLRAVRSSGWMADFAEYTPFDAVSAGNVQPRGPLPSGWRGESDAVGRGPAVEGSGTGQRCDASLLHTDMRANKLHNRFPELWAQVNREAVDAFCEAEGCDDSNRPVFFMRSGGLRSQAHNTLQWMGDQLVTFDRYDGLASAIVGQITGGLSGAALSHSDVGGYTMLNKFGGLVRYLRGSELLERWQEHSAFGDVVLRTHLGNLGAQSAQVFSSPAALAVFARWTGVHRALFSYRKAALAAEQQRSGTPWVRHPWLHWPCDAAAQQLMQWSDLSDAAISLTVGDGHYASAQVARFSPDDALNGVQYMAGPALMAAPVTGHAVGSRSLYLPPGRWEHVWSGEVVDAAAGCVVTPEASGADIVAAVCVEKTATLRVLHGVNEAVADANPDPVVAEVCGGSVSAAGTWVHAQAPLGQPPVFCLLSSSAYHGETTPDEDAGRDLCATIRAGATPAGSE